jgi:cytochrome c553
MHFRATVLVALLLAACGARVERSEDAYSASGELVALSGGGAGARNACHVCHGLAGEGNNAGAPPLSGLPYGYLLKQLQDYADGRRQDRTMHAIASRLTLEQRQLVSAWYASRDAPAAAQVRAATPSPHAALLWHSGDARRGLPPCAACHGELGEGVGPAVPPMHDRPALYLAEQLERWRLGKRQNDPERVMARVTQRLTTAERHALAHYVAGLPGASAVGAQSTAPSLQMRRPDQ